MKGGKQYEGIGHLLLLILIVPLAVYQLALKQTIRSVWNYSEQRKIFENIQNVSGGSEQQVHEVVWQSRQILDKLLPLIMEEKCVVQRYTPFVSERSGELTIYTLEFIVKGGYIPLLKVLYYAENKLQGCKVQTVTYRTLKPQKATGLPELQMTLLLQHLADESMDS